MAEEANTVVVLGVECRGWNVAVKVEGSSSGATVGLPGDCGYSQTEVDSLGVHH